MSNETAAYTLEYILEHPGWVNVTPAKRRSLAHEALCIAYDAVRTKQYRRVLDYIINHEQARLFFGGSDAVGPALREAVFMLRSGRR